MWSRYLNVTDGWTKRQKSYRSKTVLCLALLCKNVHSTVVDVLFSINTFGLVLWYLIHFDLQVLQKYVRMRE